MPFEDIKPGISRESASRVAREILDALRNTSHEPEPNPFVEEPIPALPDGASAEQKTQYNDAVKTLKGIREQLNARAQQVLNMSPTELASNPDAQKDLARATTAALQKWRDGGE